MIRSLRAEEVDVCYQQCHIERKRGELEADVDFWRQLTQYRFCLQLAEVRSSQSIAELPTTLVEWNGGYSLPSRLQMAPDEDTIVKKIRDHVYTQVLEAETLVRLVGDTTAQFNALVKKLEDNAANADFWVATPSAT